MEPPLKFFLVVVAVLLGANIGSFLNVCIFRMPRVGLSTHRPRRSFCPSCGTGIAWFDNIPLLSWLQLGGRCRHCGMPISSRYFLVEALTAALFGFLTYRYLDGTAASWALLLTLMCFGAALIVASFIDAELRILPDAITLGGMALTPLVMLLVPSIHLPPSDALVRSLHAAQPKLASIATTLRLDALPAGIQPVCVAVAAALGGLATLYAYALYWRLVHRDQPRALSAGWLGGILGGALAAVSTALVLRPEWVTHPRIYSYVAATIGMVAGASLILFVQIVGAKVFRKPAMGFGDVKLMGLLGAFTGWTGVIVGFFLACFLGSAVGIYLLVRYRDHYLPFGPFLSIGAFVLVVWPGAFDAFMAWLLTR